MLNTQNIPNKFRFSTERKLSGISQGFSFRRRSLTVYLLLPDKKTNTKTTTKNMWSIVYRIVSYIMGSKIYIIWLSFRETRTWCLTNDFTEQANKSALHDSLSWKTKLFYRFDSFFGDRRPCSAMTEGKKKDLLVRTKVKERKFSWKFTNHRTRDDLTTV